MTLWVVPVTMPGTPFVAQLAVRASSAAEASTVAGLLAAELMAYGHGAFTLEVGTPEVAS